MDFIAAEEVAIATIDQIINKVGGKELPWIRRLIHFQQKRQIVVRPLLLTELEYLTHLKQIRDWDNQPVFKEALAQVSKWLRQGLFWMIEFSVPELFSANKRKIAEVLIRADTAVDSPTELSDQVCARFPGVFAIPFEHGPWVEKFRFISSGLNTHTELYGCEENS